MGEMKATLLQQVESHLLKTSLIGLNGEIKRKGLEVRIEACIHDAIWVETPFGEEAEVRRIIEETQITGISLLVPMLVGFEQ
jgi:DNA polymerase I-like protein with 3'-5' exonuclease and polymerase domains